MKPPSIAGNHLDGDPGDANHNVHALLLGSFPLVTPGSILLVIPEGADSTVHAATTSAGGFSGGADVLDYGAVDDIFVARCLLIVGAGLVDEVLEDGVLGGLSQWRRGTVACEAQRKQGVDER